MQKIQYEKYDEKYSLHMLLLYLLIMLNFDEIIIDNFLLPMDIHNHFMIS